MLHLYDRTSMARALTLELEAELKTLLSDRIAALGEDLIDWTEYLVVGPGDTEQDIIRHIGFSPLIEPIDGARFGDTAFAPGWDWLAKSGGWFEMIVTFGSTFAYVLLIQDAAGVLPDLRRMCREFVGGRT